MAAADDVATLVRQLVAAAPGDAVRAERLDLTGSRVDAVAAALKHARAADLSLVGCGVTTAGAARLLRALGDGVTVDLSGNCIRGDDVDGYNAFLAAAARAQPRLRRLVLTGNPLAALHVSLLRETLAEAAVLRGGAAGVADGVVVFERPRSQRERAASVGNGHHSERERHVDVHGDAAGDGYPRERHPSGGSALAPPGDGSQREQASFGKGHVSYARERQPSSDSALERPPSAGDVYGGQRERQGTEPQQMPLTPVLPHSPVPPARPSHRLLNVRVQQNGAAVKVRPGIVPVAVGAPFELVVENKYAQEAFVCKVAVAGTSFKCLYKLMPKSHHRITAFGKTGCPLALPMPAAFASAPLPPHAPHPVRVVFYAARARGGEWAYSLQDPADEVTFSLAAAYNPPSPTSSPKSTPRSPPRRR
eukprot:TRINITY_DN32669_c0_g1_i1.p1 TRINITY_DN32669_c0_g1~~TRINITY_DN32669_c0_g1_i1.p1  ORF type:complete len:442 (+),score=149.79 TRINITY_DN32669_c0_g1_i1:64-1326(+)